LLQTEDPEVQMCAIFLRVDGELIGSMHPGRTDTKGFSYASDHPGCSTIFADLAVVPGEVAHVFIVGHLEGQKDVEEAVISRLLCSVGTTCHANESLSEHHCVMADGCRTIMVGRLSRGEQDLATWQFHAMASPIAAETWIEAAVVVKRVCKESIQAARRKLNLSATKERVAFSKRLEQLTLDDLASESSTRASTPLSSPRQYHSQEQVRLQAHIWSPDSASSQAVMSEGPLRPRRRFHSASFRMRWPTLPKRRAESKWQKMPSDLIL